MKELDSSSASDRHKVTRAEVITTLLLVALFVGFVLTKPLRRRLSEHPSPDVCAELLEKYVEHVVTAIEPKPLAGDLAMRKTQARNLAAEDPSFGRCSSFLTREEAECAMRANNADEFERCLP